MASYNPYGKRKPTQGRRKRFSRGNQSGEMGRPEGRRIPWPRMTIATRSEARRCYYPVKPTRTTPEGVSSEPKWENGNGESGTPTNPLDTATQRHRRAARDGSQVPRRLVTFAGHPLHWGAGPCTSRRNLPRGVSGLHSMWEAIHH